MPQFHTEIDAETVANLSDHANEIVAELVEVYDNEVDPVLFVAAGITGCVLASAGIHSVTLNVPGIGEVTLSVNRDAATVPQRSLH